MLFKIVGNKDNSLSEYLMLKTADVIFSEWSWNVLRSKLSNFVKSESIDFRENWIYRKTVMIF